MTVEPSYRKPDPHLLDALRDLTVEEFDDFCDWKGWGPEKAEDLAWWIANGHRYHMRPVPVREFLFGSAYLRARDEHREELIWPACVDAIEEICTGGYVEALLTGGIGCGKSTIGLYVHAYLLYQLLCQISPHTTYGLDPSSEIMVVFQGPSGDMAKSVDFDRFKAMLDRAAVFKLPMFRYDATIKSKLIFPKRVEVKPIAGIDTGAIGQNVIGGQLEEIAHMALVEKSKRNRDQGVFDQAVELYTTIARRRESRFLDQGDMPSMLTLVSSKKYPDDLIHTKLREAREKPDRIYVYDKRIWEVKPGRFSGRKFWVFAGDQHRRPRIMEHQESPAPDDIDLCCHVPEEFRHAFNDDLLKALRDVAGMATLSVHPFIMNRDALAASFGKIPHSVSRPDCDFETTKLRVYPKLWRKTSKFPRYCHIDLAKSRDSAGLSIAHVQKFLKIKRTPLVTEILPIVVFDVVLEIKPPKGGEINYEKIRKLLYLLRDYGMPIKWVSCDQFQSTDMLQLLGGQGFMVGQESADKTPVPHEVARTAFYDGRVIAPAHPKAVEEYAKLEIDPKTGKIDHPMGGCFTGETRIALADGTCPTFEELSRRKEPFAVYAVSDRGIVTTEGRNVRVTKRVESVVDVQLDNYSVVTCTSDHRWMLLDGSWIEARDLTPGTSLMPLHRYPEWKGGLAGYERVWCPIRRRRILGHHLNFDLRPGEIVHHVDGNKINNSPWNLEVMCRSEHLKLHGKELWSQRQSAMYEGHKAYREGRGKEISRNTILESWREGKFGPRRGTCSVNLCGAPTGARGLCGKHYQQARRAGTLPPSKPRGKKKNHKVLSVVFRDLDYPVEVYDMTVPGLENFALASGVFVHNSKDVADAMSCTIHGLTMQWEIWSMFGIEPNNVPESVIRFAERQGNNKNEMEGKV